MIPMKSKFQRLATTVWRDGLAAVGMLAALLWIYRRLAAGWVLAGGDLQTYFFPYWVAAARALQAGKLPLWNPYLFAGAPLLANSQAGVFYPLNWPLWLLSGPTLEGLTRTLHWSVLLHLALAAVNTYLLARRLRVGRWGAALAGLLYAGGGFLGVHVEHLNQLQGLAWLPLVFWGVRGDRLQVTSYKLQVASWKLKVVPVLAFALILLAGHTQTAFIAAIGIVIFQFTDYVLCIIPASVKRQTSNVKRQASNGKTHATRNTQHVFRLTQHAARFICSLLPFTLAALIAAVQLLPTLELSRFSMRAGGLPWREAVSFSVVPWQLHQVLLPPYLVKPLLPEGVAYLGVVGLLLAGWGAWQSLRSREPERLALAALGATGLFLALGGYNPLYLLGARLGLPGLVHFRAPARFLALYVLAAAVLAGLGLEAISYKLKVASCKLKVASYKLQVKGYKLKVAGCKLGVAGCSSSPTPHSSLLARHISRTTHHAPRLTPFALCVACFVLVAVELVFAAESLPPAQATASRAYTDLRPATAHLVAAARVDEAAGQPPGRFLSISQTLFDPGDKEEITSLYGPLLSPDALWAYLVAAKNREVLTPNLPLAFGVPAVDGYDGGLLPLRQYSDFSRLLLPGGTLDGRLRENLAAIPDERWLSLLNARFLITDKVGDTWSDGIFYDRQFRPTLAEGESLTLGWLPTAFEANALGVLYRGAGAVEIALGDGQALVFPLPEARAEGPPYRLDWTPTARPLTVTFQAATGGLTLTGATLVDARVAASFYPLVLSDRFRLVHSGDVKIYENLKPLPRAFLVHRCGALPDEEAVLATMSDPAFDPASAVTFLDVELAAHGEDPRALCGELTQTPLPVGAGERVAVATYTASRVVLEAHVATPGFLLLTDAWYPGWQVEIAPLDGESGAITVVAPWRADLLFRAVPLQPGDWRVTFTYHSRLLGLGAALSGLGCLGLWGYAMHLLAFQRFGVPAS